MAIVKTEKQRTLNIMETKDKEQILKDLFIYGFYPHNKVVAGDLLRDHGIELIEICRKPYNGGLKYKPGYQSDIAGIKWLNGNNALSWGSNTGWNITSDCKYALCRVNYDDYINYEIKFCEMKQSALTNEDYKKFWTRCYLGQGNDQELSIRRAYRDLNRTIHGVGEFKTKEGKAAYELLIDDVLECIKTLTIIRLDRARFDKIHEEQCEKLIASFKRKFSALVNQSNQKVPDFTLGQAQKWINMSLKYLVAVRSPGDKRLLNYEHFHIPVDNIIQDIMLEKFGIKKLRNKNKRIVKWSRCDCQEEYQRYQDDVRKKFPNQIPLDVEFWLFNGEDVKS